MAWSWWAMMVGAGFVLGGVAAWSTNAARVFMKTLAGPLLLLALRWALPTHAPPGIGATFLDFVLLVTAALCGDYLLGLKLGRHGRDGYRQDSVGH